MNKSEAKLIEGLSKHCEDFGLLRHLYLYRCLTVQQAMKTVYHLDLEKNAKNVRSILQRLRRFGIISTADDLLDQKVMYITNKGITALKLKDELPNEIYDDKTKSIVSGHYTAAELKVKKRFVDHQVHLNQFMLAFQTMNQQLFKLPWKYSDERFITQYTGIRPDGLLQVLDYDFFLEMDMATEISKQLVEKWQHYATFLSSGEFLNKHRRIVVLFICGNIKDPFKIERRKELVRYTLTQAFPFFHSDFDVLIGSQAQLLEKVKQRIQDTIKKGQPQLVTTLLKVAQQKQFTLSYGFSHQKYLTDNYYPYELAKYHSGQSLFTFRAKQPIHFMIDDYRQREAAVLARGMLYWHNTEPYLHQFGYRPLVIVVLADDGVDQGYFDFKLVNLIGTDWLFFTTEKRLNELPWQEALFQYSFNGQVNHFSDHNLLKLVYEPNYDPPHSHVVHYKKIVKK